MALKQISGPKGKKDKGEKSGSTGGSLKSLVILLVVLDLAALGTFGYLRLVKRREVEKVRSSAETNLLRIKRNGETVAAVSRRLSSEGAQDIKEPQTLINKAAKDLQVLEFLRVQSGVSRTWGPNKNYNEVTNNVSFIQKEGFKFKDLVSLLKRIEAQNPKVQIKDINFGKRDDGEEYWRPTNMIVRTFKPRTR